MRRRAVLAGLGAAASGLAGCSGSDGTREVEETATPAPVPTDRSTPEQRPAADLSAMGVADASELGERHWRALTAGAHGFDRLALVRDDGDLIRRMRVRVRASAEAATYHFVFDVDDTDRYPSSPAYPYLEIWDDGAAYQRFGREDPAFQVAEQRAFDAPSTQVAERYRIAQLFGAFGAAEIETVEAGFAVTARDLRTRYDVTPRRLRLLTEPRDGRMTAVVSETPTYVERYDLSLRADLSDQAYDVDEAVEYRRLAGPPERPDWVATAEERRG